MLYVFHGSNTHKVADQTNKLVASLRIKRPNVEVYVFEGALTDISPVDALIEARGLFVEKHIVVLKGVCEIAESRGLVFTRLPQFAASENIFVLSEGLVHVAHKKVFTEHAHKLEEHNNPARGRPPFDPQGMVAALKARNKRALWEGYLRAQRQGESVEGTCGLLHWAVKDMLNNVTRYTSTYSRDELVGMSRALITLYHDAHRGRYNLDTALERWTLGV